MLSALFERLMEFHSNPPVLYYGFKSQVFDLNCHLSESVLEILDFSMFPICCPNK